ncbi:MAG: hypothetical protein HFE33_03200 [Clostridia bacterium]|jgi:hypothetical protein|nr:hypothetical protein [Clostridia bacterium]
MKEMDYVEVVVEKEKYAKQGVHKGMQGTILDPRNIDGCWLVVFENPITFADELFVPIKEEDLKLIYDSPTEIVVEVELLNDNYASQGIRIGDWGVIVDLTSIEGKWEVDFDGKKVFLERAEFKLVGEYATE